MNHRIYVEKKKDFAVEAKKLKIELKESLSLDGLEGVRIINIYDIFNVANEEISKIKEIVLSEIVVDIVYDDLGLESEKYISVEFLPGQFDQRADSAIQCINLISNKNDNVSVKTGKVIILEGRYIGERIIKYKKVLYK